MVWGGQMTEPGDRWWVGSTLKLDLVRGDLKLPAQVTLVDLTLREGEETPYVALSLREKLRLAEHIADAGFQELEIGYVGAIDEHYELCKQLSSAGLGVRISSHTRCYTREGEWQEEIERNLAAGAQVLTFVGFGSQEMLDTVPWLREGDVAERYGRCITHARKLGAITGFSLAGGDLLRASLLDVARYYRAAAEAGVDRLYVSDGVGGATPEAVRFLTRFVRDVAGPGPKIALHLHNTFGLAVANALAGVTAGAEYVDCIPLGLGDGAGITNTEQLALALEVLYDVRTGVDVARLVPLAETIRETFKVGVADNAPFVGRNIFCHQIDSHLAAILRTGWKSWEVVRAEALGRQRKLELSHGKVRRGRSGALFTIAELSGHGEITDEQLATLAQQVRQLIQQKGYASVEDIQQVLAAGGFGSDHGK